MTNLVEQKRLEDFKASGRVEKIVSATEKLDTQTVVLHGIAGKLANIVHTFQNDSYLLENALEENDIAGIEHYADIIDAKLDALDTKAIKTAISALSEAFGIEVVSTTKPTKDEAKKALGLKVK